MNGLGVWRGSGFAGKPPNPSIGPHLAAPGHASSSGAPRRQGLPVEVRWVQLAVVLSSHAAISPTTGQAS